MWDRQDELKTLAATTHSKRELLHSLGYSNSAGNYRTLYMVAEELGIELPDGTGTSRATASTRTDLSDILVEGSTYRDNQRLKAKLIKAGLINDLCISCSVGPDWRGKPLTLQLDHINGVRNDNRIENLRVLCPNCHSQTDTFCRGAGPYRKNAKGSADSSM